MTQISLIEDFGEHRVPLIPLFRAGDSSDLQYSIQSVSGGEIFESFVIEANGDLVIRSGADRFGTGTCVIQATDSNGLIAAAAITVEVAEQLDLSVEVSTEMETIVAPGSGRLTITVNNFGPSRATGLVVGISETLGVNVSKSSALPSSGTVTGDQWEINALEEGAEITLELTYDLPVDAGGGLGSLALQAEIREVMQPDIRADNDRASASADVVTPAAIEVLSVDPSPILNRLTGLFTQRIQITNRNDLAISGFGYALSGLPQGVRVYNTEPDDLGIVLDDQDLAPGGSKILTIEYFDPSRSLQTGALLEARSVFLNQSTPLVPAEEGVEVEKIAPLANGDVLIEFSSEPGKHYRVEYSNDMVTWKPVPATMIATTNRIQWLDNGAPKTESHPSSVTARIYRIVTLVD